ncbi:MAG TPA: ferrochelatase [Acidimicrobiales bacterium]|nr:ferrochelatase [Acidimicrobiales bacterium]
MADHGSSRVRRHHRRRTRSDRGVLLSTPTAVLLLGFGGPEGPDEVVPFLENVTRGRDVPPERLAVVAEQYALFGGVSPINGQNRALRDALDAELRRRDRGVPVYWGNRNWAPYVADTMAEIAAEGHTSIVALATSAYSSYSSCRQYQDDLRGAVDRVGDAAPEWVKVRPFWNHPGFILAMVERVHSALEAVSPAQLDKTRLVFTAHSIPLSMATTSDYETQLRDAAQLISERLAVDLDHDVVFQSRSGPPQVPWLEPDIVDHLGSLSAQQVDSVVVVPIGFISDHMEVVYDLDTLAADAAAELGMSLMRAATVGTHPLFVRGLVDLIDEHLADGVPKALGDLGPRRSPCAADCCPPPTRPATRAQS